MILKNFLWRRGNLLSIFSLICLISLCMRFHANAADVPIDPNSNTQVLALQQLEQNSLEPVQVRFDRGIPRFVSARISIPVEIGKDPVRRALSFLTQYKDLYLLKDPLSDLYLDRVIIDANFGQHVIFGQKDKDTLVFAAALAVHMKGGFVTSTNGFYLKEFPKNLLQSVDQEAAEKIAASSVPSQDAVTVRESKLTYFNEHIIGGKDPNTSLSWGIYVMGHDFNDNLIKTWLVFVNAQDGKVAFFMDINPTGDRPGEDFDIETANNTTSEIWDTFFGRSESCWDNPWETADDEWFDEDGEDGYPGTGSDAFNDGINSFNFAHDVYHYYYDNFGRRSYDNDDEQVEVMVHVGFNWRNASYSYGCDHLRFGDGYVQLDIFAHEFTHAVTRYSADLVYANQSGALNESYSDVFGVFLDGNWEHAEGIPPGARPPTGGPIRDLSNPPRFSDPDHMRSFVSTTSDNGGVHTNSGIPNKVAYLITIGGTHNGLRTLGIGFPAARRLYYDVLTTRLTRNSSFMDARDATVAQVLEYVRERRVGYSYRKACDVINAYSSVGLGDSDRDCDRLLDTVDPDDDGDRVPDREDNCRIVFNPLQEDMDEDGSGDVCDGDIDGDAILNSSDNCPSVENPFQDDTDGNGIGDLCQDSDGDGLLDIDDNCPNDHNPGQENMDHDLRGDACDNDRDGDGRFNTADNCPFHYNPVQEDVDEDGAGNACDNCRVLSNPFQTDTDEDGIGDLCDDDMDGDGVANEDDNCETAHNPFQFDINGDGIGLACDDDENLILSGIPRHTIEGVIHFRDTSAPILIPISPCVADECPAYLSENFRTSVILTLPFLMPAGIVDDKGFVVAKADPGIDVSMQFAPSAQFYFSAERVMGENPPNGVPPNAQSISLGADDPVPPPPSLIPTFEGIKYFLLIFPSSEVQADEEYPITIEIESKEIVPHPIPKFEKRIVEGTDEIEIALAVPTYYSFEIKYENPDQITPVRIKDTVPAEFEVRDLDGSMGSARVFKLGKGKSGATKIEWDLSASDISGTLVVGIETIESPGHGQQKGTYKPLSCGTLTVNNGAVAYEVDPNSGKIVLQEVVDPETQAVTFEPKVVLGPTNALVVEAVEGAKPCK